MKETTSKDLDYPHTRKVECEEEIHRHLIRDPYRWLEDLDSEETAEWIKAQNKVTQTYLEQIPYRERIRERIKELWNYEKYGVPFKKGDRYFYTYNNGLQNQDVLYWIESLDGKPRVLLDPNKLSKEGTTALTGVSIDLSGELLAYGLSSAGSDWQEWRIRKVETGEDLDESLRWIKFTTAPWTCDSRGFFYSRFDKPEEGDELKAANYNQKLFYHKLGEDQTDDELIYERPDKKEWRFTPEVTEDGHYLIINVRRGTNPENGLFYMDLRGQHEIVELLNDFDARYVFLGNKGEKFYLMTDLDAPRSRIILIDIDEPEKEKYTEIIPETGDVLESASIVNNTIISSYLKDAHSRIKFYELDGTPIKELEPPGIGNVTGFTGEMKDSETFYKYTSFAFPGTIYRYDFKKQETSVFKKPDLPFDPECFVTKQFFVKSKDDTKIPIYINHRKDLNLKRKIPTILYGYGGFNISLTPQFNLRNLLWMQMGGIYAQANLRGGGEYGKEWHEEGIKLRKQNVFDDFISATEWLISREYTSKDKLGILGRSNGGLLVGACMTQRPDLYAACIPAVGVLDMLRFEKFTVGWGWSSDYGSVDNPSEFKALLEYSPYHNIKPSTKYPATLITTADHDDRVYPAHSFKFAAALQDAQAGDEPVLIRIDSKAGHGAGKPISKLIDEYTNEISFMARKLGLVPD